MGQSVAFVSQQLGEAAPQYASASHQQGAYAVIFDSSGRVLVVRTSNGHCYLPGGRIEPGETPAAAVAREIGEECGWAAELLAPICRRHQPIFGGAVSLDALHWRARLTRPLASIPEHELLWLSPAEAARCLHRSADRAALAASLLD